MDHDEIKRDLGRLLIYTDGICGRTDDCKPVVMTTLKNLGY